MKKFLFLLVLSLVGLIVATIYGHALAYIVCSIVILLTLIFVY